MRWSACSKSRRWRNLLFTLRIAITAIVVIPIVYMMSAETIQSPTDGLPSPSPEEKAAHDESRWWTIGGIVAALIMALLTAWLAYAVWQKDNAANDLTLKRYEVSIAAAVKASRELERANLELRGKVATLESNAAKSAGEVASLQKAAADAKAAQQRVEIDLSAQRERAAFAERSLLELQERVKDRQLTNAQRVTLVMLLSQVPSKGYIPIWCFAGDSEAAKFASEIAAVFKEAGWAPETSTMSFVENRAIPYEGIFLLVRDVNNAPLSGKMVQDAFTSVGIHTPGLPEDMEAVGSELGLLVGTKPSK